MKIFSRSLALLAVLLGQPTQAQSFAFRGGLNVADVSGEDSSSSNPLVGLVMRGSYVHPLSNGTAFEIGAAYSQKGARDVHDQLTLKVVYLELPVLVNFSPRPVGPFSGHGILGGALGIQVECVGEVSSRGVTVGRACPDADIFTMSVDVGAVVGGGLVYPVGDRTSALVDLTYTVGLFSFTDSGSEMKNRALGLQVGVASSLRD